MKFVRKVYFFTTLALLLSIFLFYSFVLRAYFALGRWPVYDQPDPKDLGFDLHHNLTWTFFTFSPFFVLAFPALGYFSRLKNSQRLLHLVPVALTCIWLLTFSSGFMEWFLD
jgi:hypothetical protein